MNKIATFLLLLVLSILLNLVYSLDGENNDEIEKRNEKEDLVQVEKKRINYNIHFDEDGVVMPSRADLYKGNSLNSFFTSRLKGGKRDWDSDKWKQEFGSSRKFNNLYYSICLKFGC